ncbi:Histidine phosphatase superfamily, clade-1 [Dillenia turbinata]|uniref:Histidine phosphatase superfamily, clade-1 n=1 Tax=Dillenia turbinata TaxID=194707 RepID=A0AAN8UQD0_9MAGN
MNSPNRRTRPKRIILIRHGESEGNLNTAAYTTTPDCKIPLTQRGCSQAYLAGSKIRKLIGEDFENDWRVYFHVSPYERTRGTLREIGKSFSKKRIIGVRDECRIREQDFGNFQVQERMKLIKETREKFGRFFYRFPEGESAADVYDRVSSRCVYTAYDVLLLLLLLFGFLESLWRDIDMNRFHLVPSHDLNIIIISHGLTLRVFLMKWFKWTVKQFEYLNNFSNCEFRVMQLGHGGEYSLAIQHSDEEMQEWGLSPEMIADQKWRAKANQREWNGNCRWYLEDFFDEFADSDKGEGESDD